MFVNSTRLSRRVLARALNNKPPAPPAPPAQATPEELLKTIAALRSAITNDADYAKYSHLFPEQDATPVALDSLTAILTQAIKTMGPLPLSLYMRQCLTHPTLGYYTTRDPLGAAGDFVTSPEILSMYGQMCGVWFAEHNAAVNKNGAIRLVEFGPGKGTLMADMISVLSKRCGGIEVVMVEASPVLRGVQCERLCGRGTEPEAQSDGLFVATAPFGSVRWVETEWDVGVSTEPTYVMAHEFYDALPVQLFEHTPDGWREVMVDFRTSGDKTGTDPFHLVVAPSRTPSCVVPETLARLQATPVGTRVEVCPDAESYTRRIAELVGTSGAALVIDYGPLSAVPADSLRGIKNHRFVSPFSDCGAVDLSADVDFGAIAAVATAAGATSLGPVDQGDWLVGCGLGLLAFEAVKTASSPEEARKVEDAFIRLIGKGPDSMGSIYKVLGLVGSPQLPRLGFGPAAQGA